LLEGKQKLKVVAIVQARMGSRRLPGKVLLDLAGKPMICFLLERVARSSTIDGVILATGDGSDNDRLSEITENAGFQVYRGPEDDVLSRYAQAAQYYEADIIARLTGDCPFMDPDVIDRLVTVCLKGRYDYVTNVKPPTWPDGLDVSVFTSKILNDANTEARKKSDREHVVPWMWRMTSLEGNDSYRALNIACERDLSEYRLTIDEEGDYEFMKRLVDQIGETKAQAAMFEDIMAVLLNNPELQEINSGIERDAGYKNDLIKEYIEGERIYLRDVELSDVNDNYLGWMNDPEVTKFTASRGMKYTKDELRKYVVQQQENSQTFFKAIVLRGSDQHIGNIKLAPADSKSGTIDMGLIIGKKDLWGKGYGSEAIGLLCEHAFKLSDFRKITAGFFSGNEGSMKAFLKNGFVITGNSKMCLPADNYIVDVTWMALIR